MCRCVFADLFQPAHVHILQHGINCSVRGLFALQAVKPDHDAVQCLTLDNGVTDTQLEVLELGPHVQFGVSQRGVEIGLLALVLNITERRRIGRFALFVCGIGGACNSGPDAQTEQLARLFRHRDNIDQGQESGGLLDLIFQRLVHRRFYGELGGQIVHCHTVELRQSA